MEARGSAWLSSASVIVPPAAAWHTAPLVDEHEYQHDEDEREYVFKEPTAHQEQEESSDPEEAHGLVDDPPQGAFAILLPAPAVGPPLARTQDLALHLLRVHLLPHSADAPPLPEGVPHALTFFLGRLADQPPNVGLAPAEQIAPSATIESLAIRVKERVWANCGLRIELLGLAGNGTAPVLPPRITVEDVISSLTSLPPDEFSLYELYQSVRHQDHRVTFHLPSQIADTRSHHKETVQQRVTLLTTELCARQLTKRHSTVDETYRQLASAMQLEPHPYLLEVLQSCVSDSSSFIVSRNAADLSSQVLQPLVRSLEFYVGALHTLHLSTSAFDSSCALTLVHLLQQPQASAPLMDLREVSFAGSSVAPREWIDLLPVLSVLTQLTALDLSSTTVDDSCVHALETFLASDAMTSMQALSMRDCTDLTGELDGALLADALTANPHVIHYAFDRSPLTHDCLVHLLRRLEENVDLVSLSLGQMPCMMGPRARSIEFAGEASEEQTELEPACPPANDADCVELIEYVPRRRALAPAHSPELQDTVLQALLEFAVAHAQPREEDAKRTHTDLILRGWFNPPSVAHLPSSTGSLFLVLYQALTSASCRIARVDLAGCNFDRKQSWHLSNLPGLAKHPLTLIGLQGAR